MSKATFQWNWWIALAEHWAVRAIVAPDTREHSLKCRDEALANAIGEASKGER